MFFKKLKNLFLEFVYIELNHKKILLKSNLMPKKEKHSFFFFCKQTKEIFFICWKRVFISRL